MRIEGEVSQYMQENSMLFKSKVTYSLITALNIKNVIQKALDQLKISDFSLSAKTQDFMTNKSTIITEIY